MPAKKTTVAKTSAMIDPVERVEAPEPVSRVPVGWTTTVVWEAVRLSDSGKDSVVVAEGSVADVTVEGGSADEEDVVLELEELDEAGGSLEVELLPSWEGSLTTMEEAKPLSSLYV